MDTLPEGYARGADLFVNVAKDHVSFKDTLDEDDFIDYLCAGTLVGSLEASDRFPVPDANM